MPLKKSNKNKSFPESLKTAMHDHFCRINKIIHLPTQEVFITRVFEDFLDDIEPASQNAMYLLNQWPDIQHVYEAISTGIHRDNFEPIALDFSKNDKGFEFLIQIEIAIPQHKFDLDGNCITTHYSWGYYKQVWVFAQTVKHAAGQSIELSKQLNDQTEIDDRNKFSKKLGAYRNAFN